MQTISPSVVERISRVEAIANQWSGKRDVLSKRIAKIEKEIVSEKANQQVITDAVSLLEHAGASARLSLKESIESLVTHALRMIFKNPTYSFIVDFKNRRNQVEVDFRVKRDDVEDDPRESMGGGVVDVVAISLRFIMAELLMVKGPIILDEPVKFVSEDYVRNVGIFFREYSKRTGRQIIVVTHIESLANMAESIVRVSHDGKTSEVEQT